MNFGVFEKVMDGLGLTPRTQQSKLVAFAREAIAEDDQQFVQAGTGTGKSFAILSVALEASYKTGRPSVVICPNNALIDQYVAKDAPRIQAIAGGKFTYIKGRSRYLCANARAFSKINWRDAAVAYRQLTERHSSTEWAEIPDLDSTYGCPGSDECDSSNNRDCYCGAASGNRSDGVPCTCPYVCGAFQAKADALDANVVITNAHVLVWDYLVRQFTANSAQLLPDAGAVFVDECHELEAVGRGVLGSEIKPGGLTYQVLPGLRDWTDRVYADMEQADRSEGLADPDDHQLQTLVADARDELALRLRLMGQYDSGDELGKQYKREANALSKFLDFATNEDENFVSIIERRPGGDPGDIHLTFKCVDASLTFRSILGEQPSILVSGTIPSTGPRRLGLGDAPVDNVGHPFDYSKSTLAISGYSPKNRADTYNRIKEVAAAINDTNGGTLVLFTSWADVETVVPLLARHLRKDIADRVYVQSKDDPTSLKQDIEDFKADGNAVLIGVRTLFTGLDIPGNALRQVIIWKLPYPVPSLEVKAIEKKFGKQSYYDEMLQLLTQGIGRLIRTTDDRGRVYIADNRAANQRWRMNGMTRHIAEFSPHHRRA